MTRPGQTFTDCPECGHRADDHLDGLEPCNRPGCPCSIGREKPKPKAK